MSAPWPAVAASWFGRRELVMAKSVALWQLRAARQGTRTCEEGRRMVCVRATTVWPRFVRCAEKRCCGLLVAGGSVNHDDYLLDDKESLLPKLVVRSTARNAHNVRCVDGWSTCGWILSSVILYLHLKLFSSFPLLVFFLSFPFSFLVVGLGKLGHIGSVVGRAVIFLFSLLVMAIICSPFFLFLIVVLHFFSIPKFCSNDSFLEFCSYFLPKFPLS